jgi:hypothetical protein
LQLAQFVLVLQRREHVFQPNVFSLEQLHQPFGRVDGEQVFVGQFEIRFGDFLLFDGRC